MTIPERLSAALADRYRIERELGAGGMATVYLAHDVRHDRKVAIKVLKPELADTFVEIKSRTWSAKDAENKANRIQEMFKILGIAATDIVRDEYLEFEGVS